MKTCLLKLQPQLKDFDTDGVVDASNVYRSRGKEDRAANLEAIRDHIAELRAEKVRIEEEVVHEYEKRGEAATNAQPLASRRAPSVKSLVESLPRDEQGRFKGAPDVTPRELRGLVQKLVKMAKEGAASKDWYKESADEILRAFDGDKVAAERFIQMIAITSANTEVKANFTAAEKALLQFVAGMPIHVGVASTDDKLNDLLYFGIQWDGRKTNTFYTNLMDAIDGKTSTSTTQDLHMGRLILGREKLTDAEYTFADRLTQFAADLVDMTPIQGQAAMWVAQKARTLYNAYIEKGFHKNLTDEQKRNLAMEQAAIHYGDLLRDRGMFFPPDGAKEMLGIPASDVRGSAIAVMSEIRPSTALGIGKALAARSRAQLQEYQDKAIAAVFGERGINALLRAIGLDATQARVIEGEGGYDAAATPNFVFSVKGKEEADLLSRAMMYIFRQDSVPTARPDASLARSPDAAQGTFIRFGAPLNVTQRRAMYDLLRAQVHPSMGYTMTGPAEVMVVNFRGEDGRPLSGLSDEEFRAKIEAMSWAAGALPAVEESVHYGAETTYPWHDWAADPQGSALRDEIRARGSPDLLERLDRWADVFQRFADRQAGRVGRGGRAASPLAADGRSQQGDRGAPQEALEGLPTRVEVPGRGVVTFGPFQPAIEAARRYMAKAGLPYSPPTKYVKVDPERAARIAQAYEDMVDDPRDPEVRAAYEAMARETIEQYKAVLATGLRIEFIDSAKGDPYAASPRLAILDVIENNHLWVFPTSDGFGQVGVEGVDRSVNPMLAETEFEISGRKALANDLFRVVHDYFGHIAHGVGFRADGEENAWRSHSAMYTPLARRAMTSETRGQNSWVNFGPRAEENRGASGAETIYAEQKLGLLPKWISEEGARDQRRVERARGVAREVAEEAAGRFMAGAPNAPPIVVDDGENIPPRVREWAIERGGVEGAYDPVTKTIYIFPEQISDQTRLEYVLAHEGFGHAGLRALLGEALDPVLRSIYHSNASVRKAAAKHIERGLSIEVATEEVLAEMAGTGKVKDVKGWEKIVKAVRDFLAKLGLKRKWSDEDVQQLVAAAGKAITGEISAVGGETQGSPVASEQAPMWYSELARKIAETKTEVMPAPQWRAYIKNLTAKGVKPDEIHWSGVEEWLKLKEAGTPGRYRIHRNGVPMTTGIHGPVYPTREEAEAGVKFYDNHYRDPEYAPKFTIEEELAPKKGGKVTKAELLSFLNANGVKVEAVVYKRTESREINPSERAEIEAKIGEAKEKLAELRGITDRAKERYDEAHKALVDAGWSEEYQYLQHHWYASWDKLPPDALEKVMAAIAKQDNIDLEKMREAHKQLYDVERATKIQAAADEMNERDANLVAAQYKEGDQERYVAQLEESLLDRVAGTDTTMYSGHQAIKGLDNYREVLLTWPEPVGGKGHVLHKIAERIKREGGHVGNELAQDIKRGYVTLTDDERLELATATAKVMRPKFDDPHWNTRDPVLAHFRVADGETVDGKRVLVVQEAQTDRGQAGRDKGWLGEGPAITVTFVRENGESRNPDTGKDQNEYVFRDDRGNGFSAWGDTKEEAEQDILAKLTQWRRGETEKGVPPAPFVKRTEAWSALVMKRVIRMAVDEGYDHVVWTTGKQQVDHYGGRLRNAVDRIEWEKTPEGVHLIGLKGSSGSAEGRRRAQENRDFLAGIDRQINELLGDRNTDELNESEFAEYHELQRHRADATTRLANGPRVGQEVVNTHYAENQLSSAIGKAMADRIREDPNQTGVIDGNNITIDDVGMGMYYDHILPSVTNEVLKKLGGERVKTIEIAGEAVAAPKYEVTREEPDAAGGDMYVYSVEGPVNRRTGRGTTTFQVRQRPQRHQPPIVIQSFRSHGQAIGYIESVQGQSRRWVVTRDGREMDTFDTKEEAESFAQESRDAHKNPPTRRQPGFDITPAMREKVLGGMPLFSARPNDRRGRQGLAAMLGAMQGSMAEAPKAGNDRGREILTAIARDKDSFQFGESNSRDWNTIAKEMGLDAIAHVEAPTRRGGMTEVHIAMKAQREQPPFDEGATEDNKSEMRPVYAVATLSMDKMRESHPDSKARNTVYVDTSALDQGMGGKQVYQLIHTWAANNGYTFVPDPRSVSPAAMEARIANDLAAAMRLGTTAFMWPPSLNYRNEAYHYSQPTIKWLRKIDDEWQDVGAIGDKADQANQRLLIETQLAIINGKLKAAKVVDDEVGQIDNLESIEYNFEDEQIVYRDSGEPVPQATLDRLARALLPPGVKIPEGDRGRQGAGDRVPNPSGQDGADVPQAGRAPARGARATLVRGIVLQSALELSPSDVRKLSQSLHSGERPAAGTPRSGLLASVRPDWLARGNPDLQSAAGKVDTYAPQKTFAEKLKEFGPIWQERAIQKVFDSFAPLKKLGRKEYVLARMTRAADSALEATLTRGKPKLHDDGYLYGDLDQKGFLGHMQDLAGEHDRFMLWVAGNRAARLAKEDRENLFSDAEIAAMRGLINQQFTGDTWKGQGTRPQAYAKAAAAMHEYNKSVLDIAEKTGLIDGEGRKFWEHEFYVPFFRMNKDMDGRIDGPSKVKGLVRQEAFKRLKGGKENLGDLLENTLSNWGHILNAAMANQAALASLKKAEDLGVATSASEAVVKEMADSVGFSRGATYAMDGGVKRWFFVDDPLVLEAVSALENANLKGLPMEVMSKFKHYLTLGVTASPTFRIRNLMRDSISAIAQNDMSYNAMKNVAQGFKGASRKSDEYAQAMFNGAMIRFGQLTDGKHAEHAKRLILSGIKDQTILDTPTKVKDALGKLWDEYQEFGDKMENVNRLARYQQGLDRGESPLEAAFAARDMLDFSLQGSSTAIRVLTQVVPFMNARLQGMYRLGRSAKEHPGRMAAVTGMVALASLALFLAYKDDPDWQAREDWDRDNFWWFKIGNTAYRIPKPFEIGAIGTLAERSAELAMSDEMTGERFGERLKSMLGDTFALNPTPQLFKPAIDLYANKDSFTGRMIETRGLEQLSKPERMTSRTSGLAKLAGKAGDVTGLSPVQIDHLVDAYFGWLGAHIVMAADMAASPLVGGPEKPARKLGDYFVVGDFAKDLPSNRSRYAEEFYKQSKAMHEVLADVKRAREIGDMEKVRTIMVEKGDKVAIARVYTTAERTLGELNRRQRVIEAGSMPAEEKRQRLDEIAAQRNELTRTIEKMRLARKALAPA